MLTAILWFLSGFASCLTLVLAAFAFVVWTAAPFDCDETGD